MDDARNVVMFSGGAGSWAAAKRVADQYGTDGLILLFADTLMEDEDLYRFLRESAANVGGKLVWLKDGRNVWEVFEDDKFLGNSRLANCSKYLKQIPCRRWLEQNTDPDKAHVHVGIDWSEIHRLPAIVEAYKPWKAHAPLCEKPYLSKDDIWDMLKREGIRRPRLYDVGMPHNNCGGFCVRAGHAQFAQLLRTHRERFLYHEGKEQELREFLGKDVAILRDRTGGKSTPLTLRQFRERIEAQGELFDGDDWGGCGCFVDSPEAVAA